MSDAKSKHGAMLLTALLVALSCAPALVAQSKPRIDSDFSVGDRIALRVDVEPQLTDTFTVSPGPALLLPIVGSVSLAGVRRDQIEKVLTDAVAKYYRNPLVHVRALIRIAVLGEVQRPGFYAVPVDMLVPDVLMTAGGPTPAAQVNAIRVDRGGMGWLRADSTKKSVARGLTLSQLGIRSEDQFVVPRTSDSESKIRFVAELLAIPIAIVTVVILIRH
jgi:protein involved in polysaccharide export with SLBB domain